MIFCGQCGLQLPPGSTRCQRCGAPVEPADLAATGGDLHVDDATVASRAFIVQNRMPPQTPNSQQPLILRGDSSHNYTSQDASGATSRVEQVNYNVQLPPAQQVAGHAYDAYPSQPGIGYSPAQPSGGYPAQSHTGYPLQNTGGYPPQISHPGYVDPAYQQPGIPPHSSQGYPPYPAQYPVQQRASSAKGRTTALILVLIGLLLIMSAAVLFAMQQGLIKGLRLGEGNYSQSSTSVPVVQHSNAPHPYSTSISQRARGHVVVTVRPPLQPRA